MTAASWTLNPFLCIDTETTGVDPFEDRIVQIATCEVWPEGAVGNEWERVVDPGVEIPSEASVIHGVTNGRAATEGIPPDVALASVADAIYAHHDQWHGQGAIVMFNARFDLPMMISEAERHGVDFPCVASILDPYLIDRMCDRYRKGGRRLTIVADHYGVSLGDRAHGALADATAAGQVMVKLLDRFPQIGEHSLAHLWLRQTKGHEDDRQRFVDWQRRNNDPSFDSAPGWPLPAGVA